MNTVELESTTRKTVAGYFDRLQTKSGWDALLSEDLDFTQFTSPVRRTKGKDAYLDTTRRFYASVVSLEVKALLVEGTRACAFTEYQIQAPGVSAFSTHVAEVFEVNDGQIAAFQIYFDSAGFPK
jgi:ketosteroid isomerase-like protein